MIIGTGIDLVEVRRIRNAVERRGEKFLARVFTSAERDESTSGAGLLMQRLAGRFAAKEAFMKALGTGLARGVTWQDVSVVSGDGGAPRICLEGVAAQIAKSRGVAAVHISISHSTTTAAAIVILEGA